MTWSPNLFSASFLPVIWSWFHLGKGNTAHLCYRSTMSLCHSQAHPSPASPVGNRDRVGGDSNFSDQEGGILCLYVALSWLSSLHPVKPDCLWSMSKDGAQWHWKSCLFQSLHLVVQQSQSWCVGPWTLPLSQWSQICMCDCLFCAFPHQYHTFIALRKYLGWFFNNPRNLFLNLWNWIFRLNYKNLWRRLGELAISWCSHVRWIDLRRGEHSVLCHLQCWDCRSVTA